MKRNILILTTGGTIASVQTPHGLIPALTSEELLSFLPEVDQSYRLNTMAVCNLDSTDMTYREWLMLAETIERYYDAYDGFVICHGTDTLAYTAGALSYLIQNSPKPIVLTGAQKPIGSEITDAKANLRDSILYAAEDRSRGVQIVFDGKVIAGARAKKTKSFSYAAFSSINFPYLAMIQDNRIIRYVEQGTAAVQAAGMQQGTGGNDIAEPVFYRNLNPKVFLLKLTPGMSPYILEDIFKLYDCIIVESFGVGGMPESLLDAFCRLLSQYPPEEKVLIMTTQVTYEGSNVGVYEVGNRLKERFQFLEARDMTLEAVLTKIMWIMGTNPSSWEEIRTKFYQKIGYDTLFDPE